MSVIKYVAFAYSGIITLLGVGFGAIIYGYKGALYCGTIGGITVWAVINFLKLK
jgi:hypothetical protein